MSTDIEMTADFDRERTPTAPPESCWRCKRIQAVSIVAPAPGSVYEAKRLPTCIVCHSLDWAICAVTFFLRLGKFEIYFGPDRRESARVPFDLDRRRPQLPPRQDDK